VELLRNDHDSEYGKRQSAVSSVSMRRAWTVTSVGWCCCIAGLALWLGWLGWRVTAPVHGVIGVGALLLELVAFSAALVVSVGLVVADLTSDPDRRRRRFRAHDRTARWSVATALDIEPGEPSTVGADDTGEVAWARHGLRVLAAPSGRHETPPPSLTDAAGAVIAVDGLRRLMFVALLVAVLFTGQAPFGVPAWWIAALLGASQLLLSIGHWLLSDRILRPGDRFRWSMGSIGAGLGDGVYRTGLPIRWTATMATMVVLNLSVSLRGLSDRWTHGLGAMPHDERVATMSVALVLVLVGFASLRGLRQPELGFYGATRRLEEGSTRRWALGATLAVAALGFTVGVLPAGAPA